MSKQETIMKAKFLIPMLTLTCLLATPALAQVNYAVSGSSAYVTNSPNASGNIVIASTYQGKPVTSIGGEAFSGCTSLMNVTIPNSVTSIGSGAFEDCTSLTTVTIPNSVTDLGYSMFSDCTSLTSVTIPNSVTGIRDYAFYNCTSLMNVTIPNSVTEIGEYSFSHCTSLTSVTIPNSVTYIWGDAFAFCTSLTSVTIPNSVTGIDWWAFSDCTSLTSVTFLGNAPSERWETFSNVALGAKVYYYYGTTGWGPTYGGLPTVMLGAPAPQVAAASAGVKPGGFGFTLNGVVHQTIVVEASTNLGNPVWIPVDTNTLTGGSSYFSDPEWTNHPARFYRAVTP